MFYLSVEAAEIYLKCFILVTFLGHLSQFMFYSCIQHSVLCMFFVCCLSTLHGIYSCTRFLNNCVAVPV
jgi:hypothetical protein